MQIKYSELMLMTFQAAQHTANECLHSKENVDIEDIKALKYSPLSTEYGLKIVGDMIVQGICNYHEQLRAKLLESNIDIGKIDFQSDIDVLENYFKFHSGTRE